MKSVEIARDAEGAYFLLENKIKVRVDFQRRHDIGLKSDLLARAVGFKKGMPLKVIDATAGLCRDSFHLVCLGCEVVALEQNEKIFAVVAEQINSLSDDLQFQIILVEARKYLQALDKGHRPDVIYLDPMFPEKKKSAKSGKESELLKALAPIASSEDEIGLLKTALSVAKKRVVVKRPLSASPILPKPQVEFVGRAIRYDVYVVPKP